jgi:Mn2+/Fe2+ NRAMP family transporter
MVLQGVNGLVLPDVRIALLRLANDEELMGKYKNGPTFNLIAWGAVVAAVLLSITLVGLTLGEWTGVL